jgi:hypothetical protein
MHIVGELPDDMRKNFSPDGTIYPVLGWRALPSFDHQCELAGTSGIAGCCYDCKCMCSGWCGVISGRIPRSTTTANKNPYANYAYN